MASNFPPLILNKPLDGNHKTNNPHISTYVVKTNPPNKKSTEKMMPDLVISDKNAISGKAITKKATNWSYFATIWNTVRHKWSNSASLEPAPSPSPWLPVPGYSCLWRAASPR
jgi:hypothetical protein